MITLFYAGILGLMSVFLANQVLYVRLRGDKEEKWRGDAVLRVQANFIENVPIALILLFILEYVNLQNYLIHLMGILLTIFRLLHAIGMSNNPGANYPRLIGAQGTFLLISAMGFMSIIIGVSNF